MKNLNIEIPGYKFSWKNNQIPVKLAGSIYISNNVNLKGMQMEDHIIFDKDEVIKRFDGEEEFLTELVGIFINDIPELLSRIKEAVDNLNSKDLEKSAHRLKGAIANFAEKAAFEAALQLEMMGRENRMDEVEEAYDTLEKEMHCLVNALKEFVE